jgi:hypothetical protein
LLLQPGDQGGGVAEQHTVVGHAVHQQQRVVADALSMDVDAAEGITFGICRQMIHVALSVVGVVHPPVGDRVETPTKSWRPRALIAEALQQAEAMALRSKGDPSNFTLIQNGPRLARREWPYVYIVCSSTRFRKGPIYIFIGLKNLLAGLRE